MKKILILFLISHSSLSAQLPQMVHLDSLWALRTINQPNQKGAYTISYSERVDSATLVAYYINLMTTKKQIIDSNILDREFKTYDDHLYKITGMHYQDHITAQLIADLDGRWQVITESDTIDINIKKLKVTGGTIHGAIKILDTSSLSLNGVLPEPVTLRSVSGRLSGTLRGKKISMVKI